MATARLGKDAKIFLCRVATSHVLPDACVKIFFKPKQENPLVLPLAGVLLPVSLGEIPMPMMC